MDPSTMIPTDETGKYKREAAERAVEFAHSGMVVGLGTGSTAIFATRRIAQLVRDGTLRDILCFATSRAVWAEAVGMGLSMTSQDMPSDIHVTIDGADEVDPALNLIKGGGGALFREKIVAQASARVVIVVDESKLSPVLGTRHVVPVEVLPFGWRSQLRFIESLSAIVTMRRATDGAQFITDSGNLIFDCDFGPIADPAALAHTLATRAGIVEHGLFLGIATDVIVAGKEGVRQLRRE